MEMEMESNEDMKKRSPIIEEQKEYSDSLSRASDNEQKFIQ